jgi:subtilisin family serine protease
MQCKLLITIILIISLLATSSSFLLLLQPSILLPKNSVSNNNIIQFSHFSNSESIFQIPEAMAQTSDEATAPPQSIPGLNAITSSEHALIQYCEVTQCSPPIQEVNRVIFNRPFLPLACNDSLLELKPSLLPTTNIQVLAGQIANQHNLKIQYTIQLPGYKAIAIKKDPTNKVFSDPRFSPVINLPCNEFILEVKPSLLPTTDILSLAGQIAKTPGSYIHYVYNLPGYKAIAIRSDINNQVLNDERFLRYNLANNNKAGELDQFSGHVAQLTIRWNQTVPEGIKRTFSDATFTNSNITPGAQPAQVAAKIAPTTTAGLVNKARSQNGSVDADIAILDTGISLTHPDLNVYKNATFVEGTTSGNDDNGHGSHVSGIAAAKNNSIGIVGVAPGARLWAIKVCDASGECPISNQIKGIEYAIKHANEIDVLNISIENLNSPALNAIIKEAVKAGITVVAAAGNSGKSASQVSPANSPDVLTVSAIGDSDGKCGSNGSDLIVKEGNGTRTVADDSFVYFSNFGPNVEIAAPGVDILSTYKGNGYAVDSGTSMAAPYVTGAAALFKAQFHKYTPSQIKSNLELSGSSPQTICDGGAHGYFTGDNDSLPEPLLFRTPGGIPSSTSSVQNTMSEAPLSEIGLPWVQK